MLDPQVNPELNQEQQNQTTAANTFDDALGTTQNSLNSTNDDPTTAQFNEALARVQTVDTIPDGAGNTLAEARNIEVLTDYQSFTDAVNAEDPNDFYKLTLDREDTVSVFLNGLAAGTKIELLDNAGNLIETSTNTGTSWSANNSEGTGGSITRTLAAGTYFVNVTPDEITGNLLYDQGDKYSLMFQSHSAPDTIVIAAANTENKGSADLFADGTDDQEVINQAIQELGEKGGGTVLLLDGTYDISNNIMITYDKVNLRGVGWNTHLRQADDVVFSYAGMLRSMFAKSSDNVIKSSFIDQNFKHFRLDGNKANQTNSKNAYGNFGTYEGGSFEDLRVHDFKYYGLDPHENSWAETPTVGLLVKDNLADRNGVDGITLDNVVDSVIEDNISDANGRHGINIVTDSENNIIRNNVVANNQAHGIVVQSGSDKTRTSDNNILVGNVSKFNNRHGIYVELANNTLVENNLVQENGQHGIQLRSASFNTVRNNQLLNNSQQENNRYIEIYVDDYSREVGGEWLYSTNNLIEENNILNNKTNRAKYGIRERSPNDDFNTYKDNIIEGPGKDYSIVGQNSQIVIDGNASTLTTGRTVWDAAVGDPMKDINEAPKYEFVDFKNNDQAGNNQETARSLGSITDYFKVEDYVGDLDLSDFYSFNVTEADRFSIFLNGLAGGTKIELLDSNGSLITSSTNKGTTGNNATEGSITTDLDVGNYFVNVTPGEMIGNSFWDNDDKYSLLFQPHNADETFTIAAANSSAEDKASADFVATGKGDQNLINDVIRQVGQSGGGSVVLLGGTYDIADNIRIVYDNVNLSGVGWLTHLRQANNVVFENAGMLRSALHSEAENILIPRFYNQNVRHLRLDGNKENQTSASNSYGNYGTYGDSSFEDLRVTNFGAYGFDPHENSYAPVPTIALTITDSLADNNGKDGITIDNLLYSLVADNISDSNVRHGMNIVTESRYNDFVNNITTNNGGNGITVQPGAVNISRTSDFNLIRNNISSFNQRSGIYTYLGQNNEIFGNVVSDNGRHGIQVRSSSYNLISNNTLRNNGRTENNKYHEIYLDDDGVTASTHNEVYNNDIANDPTLEIRARWGIAERTNIDDFNILDGNIISGVFSNKPIRLLGPNSVILS
ncbi:right-handed parallel beta-helix repeat-containing protein [Aerosakkonemataceae cyanobacterium BLCC-F154]|uniref:Right-handed parallel beta-helix repeat-containing protein n=1 Tax=Floridaenema fluviatile BLCC-F154 TaxID=3153640 RepID=A0ABV4YM62_9CYAN